MEGVEEQDGLACEPEENNGWGPSNKLPSGRRQKLLFVPGSLFIESGVTPSGASASRSRGAGSGASEAPPFRPWYSLLKA